MLFRSANACKMIACCRKHQQVEIILSTDEMFPQRTETIQNNFGVYIPEELEGREIIPLETND